MSGKTYKWVKVAESAAELDFGANAIAVADMDGKAICIGRYQEALFAFAHKCPHASGILAEGYVDVTGNIVCPVHRYKFNLLNGRNISGEGYYLKTYLIEKSEEGIFIVFEEKGFFDFL